jgi:hypothetical protein
MPSKFADLGPRIPLRFKDTPPVQISSWAALLDLDQGGRAIVTFNIRRRNSFTAPWVTMVLAVAPRTLEVMCATVYDTGQRRRITLDDIPGICFDLALSRVAELFPQDHK